jgi:hypothetical protein
MRLEALIKYCFPSKPRWGEDDGTAVEPTRLAASGDHGLGHISDVHVALHNTIHVHMLMVYDLEVDATTAFPSFHPRST